MKTRKEIRTSVIQAAPVVGDIPANLRKIEKYANEGENDLLVFPELFLTGYLLKDEYSRLAITMDSPEMRKLELIARDSGSHIIVGTPFKDEHGKLYNSSLLIGPGGFIGRYDKWQLVNFLPFDEKRYFTAGTELPVFDTDIGRIGLIICYDIFFPELCTALTMKGADIIVSISATPTFSRKFFEIVAPARAVENTVFVIFNNLTGTEERLTFWGGASIHTPRGFPIAKGEYFKEQAIQAVLDLREVDIARKGRTVIRDKRPRAFEILNELAD